jgi:hypothetical protein
LWGCLQQFGRDTLLGSATGNSPEYFHHVCIRTLSEPEELIVLGSSGVFFSFFRLRLVGNCRCVF